MKDNTLFPALTGLRAVAAYMVFFHHFNPFAEGTFIHELTSQLHLGVTLFFVLSGFLITWRYFNAENFHFKTYMVNRIARIYPMYFLLTTLTFIYFYFKFPNNISTKLYLHNLFFTKGFFDDLKFTGIAQGWSLTVEEMFYVLAPFFFILLRKSYRNLILLPVIFLGIGLFFITLQLPNGFLATPELVFGYTFMGRCSEFFVGMALAIVLFKTKKNYKICTILSLLTISIGLCFLAITNHFWGQTILSNLLLPLFGIAPLLYGLITEKTVVSRFLSTPIMTLLGKSSYVFYLIHMGIFVNLSNKFSESLVFRFLFINALSVLLYLFLEKPINAFIRNQFSKPAKTD